MPNNFLVEGVNVLAAEVHQNGGGSSDIVFGITLDAEVLSPGSPNPAYESALKTFDGLRITELMFNPSDGSAMEFVELQNIGSDEIELGGVRFVEGINFTFPAMSLAPGGYVLVVSDPIQFEAKYGAGLPVAGAYTGQLSNGGEEIALQLPVPFDANILKFAYGDKWYPLADGGGYSLEIIDPGEGRPSWDQQSSWRIGALQGTPGSGISLSAGTKQITDISDPVTLAASVIGAWSPALRWEQIGGPGSGELRRCLEPDFRCELLGAGDLLAAAHRNRGTIQPAERCRRRRERQLRFMGHAIRRCRQQARR